MKNRTWLRSCLLALLAVHLAGGSLARADAVIAHQHFEAAVRAFDEQRLADAATEFERAYEAEPNWTLLYNLGSVYAALGDAVRSLDAFRRYLTQGASRVPAERREQVELELERQRAKVGMLLLRVEPAGGEIRIDGNVVGLAPLGALERNAGWLSLDVGLEGYRPIHRQVELLPLREQTVELQLQRTAPAVAAPLRVVHTGRAQRIVGFALGGAGLVGLGVGAAILVHARFQHSDAVELANRDMRPRAERLESDASHQQTLSYAVIGVGGAVFLAGALLVLSAPAPSIDRARLEARPWVSATSAGLHLHSTW